MTYAALGREEEALEQLRRAVEIAGPEDERSQFDTARAEIERLESGGQPDGGQGEEDSGQ
jgi:hypothetical protein